MREVRYLLLLASWPFLYFWPYLMSFGLTPGNDFHTLYYRYKLYLIDLLASGRPVPVWSPTEAAGFPFRANPFVGARYPLNYLLALFYRINEGYSEFDHVVFTIAAYSIFAIGIAVWLRSTGEKPGGAILAALIVATSLKMSELIRFPNAAHAAAWIPWLLAGITISFQKRRAVSGAILCLVSSYCLMTAGYPYFVYYTQFLAGPWLVLMCISRSRQTVCTKPDDTWNPPTVALTSVLSGCGIALALCFPWLREMKLMLDATTDRKGGNWDYSTAHDWTVVDVLGSLVYPPRASMEGWYFFGVTALALVVLFAVVSFRPGAAQTPAATPATARSRRLLLGAGALWVFLSLLTLEENSPLFAIMWRYYPGFSSLRVWGRMNIILLPIFALLLSRSWSWWQHHVLTATGGLRIRYSLYLAAIGIVIVVLQMVLAQFTVEDPYWRTVFLAADRPFASSRGMLQWTVMVLGCIGTGFWVVLSLGSRDRSSPGSQSGPSGDLWKRHRIVSIAALMLPVLSAFETCGYGYLQWADRGTDTHPIREVVDIPSRLREGLLLPRALTASSVSLGSRFQLGLMSNWYFDRYVKFLCRFAPRPSEIVSDPGQLHEVPGMMEMLGVTNGQRFFFVPQLEYSSPQEFVDAARSFRMEKNCREEVRAFDGDVLDLKIECGGKGYLCYIDNWDPSWRSLVNRREVPVELLMGTFKAVPIDSQTEEVLFFCTDEPLPVGVP